MNDARIPSSPSSAPASRPLPASDIPRRRSPRSRWLRAILSMLLVLAGGISVIAGLRQLEPALPTVSGTVLYGNVKRGLFVREISGRGPLVPLHITIVSTNVAGQISQVHVEPGVPVDEGTVLIVMTDRALERNLIEAQRSVTSAEIEHARFQVVLEQQDLDLRAATAQAFANYEDAKSEFEMKSQLAKLGLISTRENELSRLRADRSLNLLELQLARVKNYKKTNDLQMREKDALITRAHDVVDDRQRDVDSLTIRATNSGILQELGPSAAERWEVGQRIAAGTRVAKITDPQQLKAMIDVTDVQAKEVLLGLPVIISRSTQIQIPGRVSRVDPAVRGGRVAVDVELLGALPDGARPDLEVFGTIELERAADVLQLTPSPFMSEANNSLELFRVSDDGMYADRVSVQLGRTSLNTVEVLGGLVDGDRVITSDMSRYEGVDRVRLPEPRLPEPQVDWP